VRSLIPIAVALILGCSGATPVPPTTSPAAVASPTASSTTAQPSSTSVASITGQPSPSAVVTNRPSLAPAATASPQDEQFVRTIIEFARAPGTARLTAIPFAEKVKLGLSDRIVMERARSEFVQADAWVLRADIFRGRYGPFSLLELLARDGPTTISVGPHPHCASSPVPPPTEFASARRLSVQPTGIDTCLFWWTVDLFVSPAGRIEAITLDLWDP
jgi:hypothetical protein